MNAAHRRLARRLSLLALVLAVLAVHWGLGRWLDLPGLAGDGTPPLRRIEVAFVQELQPAAPPPAPVPAARRPAAPRAAAMPQIAAAPEIAASAPVAVPAPAAEAEPPDAVAGLAPPLQSAPERGSEVPPEEDARAASSLDAAADTAQATAPAPPPPLPEDDPVPAVAGAANPAGDGTAVFPGPEWPLSTRLSYVLTGNFRGPVDGQARVDWLRQGTRYQVHLELSVGPFFAPLASRRLSSEGEITPEGLHPLRYEEETRIAFRDPRRLRIDLDGPVLRLPSGRTLPRPAGVQDSASQFVHMTWLFTLQPQRLQAGQTVALPLALPRVVEEWTYDIVGPDTLHTPMGELPVVHVRPRRETTQAARQGGDLTAEFWVAPTLQYLPARILIRQSEEVWIDLRLDRLPQQASAPAPVSAPDPALIQAPGPR